MISTGTEVAPRDSPAPALARRLRGLWRLARMALHLLFGVLLVATRFGRIDAEARMRHVQRWAATFLRLVGVRLVWQGTPRPGAKLLVANHVSWLDILALDAVVPARFVAKNEVRHWPVFGGFATGSGTLYIQRERPRDALRVVHQMAAALQAGETVAIFPEGTTADGHVLLPFHANLLQAAIATATPVQPAVLRYADASHAISLAALWLGETTLARSLWQLACAEGLRVRLQVLPAEVSAHADRRRLSEHLRKLIAERLDG